MGEPNSHVGEGEAEAGALRAGGGAGGADSRRFWPPLVVGGRAEKEARFRPANVLLGEPRAGGRTGLLQRLRPFDRQRNLFGH